MKKEQKNQIGLPQEIHPKQTFLKINYDQSLFIPPEGDTNLNASDFSHKSIQAQPIQPISQNDNLILKSYLIDHMTVEVREKVFEGSNFGSGYETKIALKNHNSYLIGNMEELRLRENEKEVYFGSSPQLDSLIRAIIYIPSLNAYFIVYSDNLYRKDVDDKPPYLYTDQIFNEFPKTEFVLFSEFHQRLFTSDFRGKNLGHQSPDQKN